MKKIYLFLFFCPLVCFAQSKPTELIKVKAAIKKSLFYTMKDYQSYQPVRWGPLQKELTSYEDTVDGSVLLSQSEIYLKTSNVFIERAKFLMDSLPKDQYKSNTELKLAIDSMSFYAKKSTGYDLQYKKGNKNYPHRPVSYTITHSFRGKNSYGAYGLSTITYTLDKNFKITNRKDEDASESE